MALTFEQEPTATIPQPAFEPIVYVLSSTNVASAKFRFVAQVFIDGAQKAELMVLPNGNNVGVIRVDAVIQQFLDVTIEDQNTSGKTVHTLGENDGTKLVSVSEAGAYRTVNVRFGESFASSATAAPTTTILSTNKYVRVLPSVGENIGDTSKLKMPYESGGSFNVVTGDDDWLSCVIPTDNTTRFLTTRPVTDTAFTSLSTVSVIQEDVTYNDYRTLSFLADSALGMSGSMHLVIDTTNTSGTTNRFTSPIGTLGGSVDISSANTDSKRLQTIGTGPANILGFDTTVDADFASKTVSYYEVFLASVANPGSIGEFLTTPVRYNIVDADCLYKQKPLYPTQVQNSGEAVNFVTLAWQNSLGGYDYQIFQKRHDRTTKNIKRTSFDQLPSNYDDVSTTTDFKIFGWKGGKSVTKVEARTEIRATTDIFDEAELDFLEGLALSPRVYLLNFNKLNAVTPVVLTDSSYLHKRGVNERGVYTMSVTFEFARPKATLR